MRDIETIDGVLRLVSRARRAAREMGCTPSTVHIDDLLDERTAAILFTVNRADMPADLKVVHRGR